MDVVVGFYVMGPRFKAVTLPADVGAITNRHGGGALELAVAWVGEMLKLMLGIDLKYCSIDRV